MKDIRELLQTRPLLFDGAMGTYYKAAPGVECEQANLTDPAGVLIWSFCSASCLYSFFRA